MSADPRRAGDCVDTVDEIEVGPGVRALPQGWASASLGALSDVIRGITFPASAKEPEKSQANICCLRTANIQSEIIWNDVYFVPREYIKRDDQVVKLGDILMSMANSYELVGKVAVARHLPYETAFGAFLGAIRPKSSLNGQYLFHFLRTQFAQNALRKSSSQTTNIANISVSTLSEIPVPVAPLPEQKRIADKLDRLLARVDACRERLDRIPALLKRFRQSVLAAATSGELTREWREERGQQAEGTGLPPTWVERKIGELGNVQLGRQRSPKFHSGDSMRPYLRVQNA